MGRTQFAGPLRSSGSFADHRTGCSGRRGRCGRIHSDFGCPTGGGDVLRRNGSHAEATSQPVPWSFSFTNKDASPTSMLVVTANPTGQKTTCMVSVNGTVKDTQSKTGAGEDNMVQCSTMGNP